MMDETSFKLTFNKPAELSYFTSDRGEKFTGLQIRMAPAGDVEFRPVAFSRERSDVAPLTERSRGGMIVTVEGALAGDILAKLREQATAQKPFFTLSRQGKGWFGIQHYEGVDAPAKIIPHMRLWTQRDEAEAEPMVQEAIDFVAQVRLAQRVIAEHQQERRIGRPPAEVAKARETIANFERVVAELMPDRAPKLDLRALTEAHSLIGAVLAGARDPNVPVYTQPVETLRADPPIKSSTKAATNLAAETAPAPAPEIVAELTPEEPSKTEAAPVQPVEAKTVEANTEVALPREPVDVPLPLPEPEPKAEPVAETPKAEPVAETPKAVEAPKLAEPPKAEPVPETRRTLQGPARPVPKPAPQKTKATQPVADEEEGLTYVPDDDFRVDTDEVPARQLTDDEIAEQENIEAQRRAGLLRPPIGRRRRRFAA